MVLPKVLYSLLVFQHCKCMHSFSYTSTLLESTIILTKCVYDSYTRKQDYFFIISNIKNPSDNMLSGQCLNSLLLSFYINSRMLIYCIVVWNVHASSNIYKDTFKKAHENMKWYPIPLSCLFTENICMIWITFVAYIFRHLKHITFTHSSRGIGVFSTT